MNDNKTNYTWAIVVGIIIVIIAIYFIVKNKNQVAVAPAGDDSSLVNTNGQPGVGMPSEDTTVGSVHTSASTASLISYDKALVTYKDRRIQFDPTCQAIPHTATYKNNTEVMLDNRSAETRSIHMGSLGTLSIKPWGFKIIMLSSTLLPNVLAVDCNQSQNVALITIQK